MQKIATKLDLVAIANEIESIKFWLDGSGAMMSIGQSKGFPPEIIYKTGIKAAVDEIGQFRNQVPLNLMINRLPPKIIVPKHQDFLNPTQYQPVQPTIERWHLPLITNPDSLWWDEVEGEFHMEPGFWWGPTPYWKLHSISNHGTIERIHLIVDLDSPFPLGSYK